MSDVQTTEHHALNEAHKNHEEKVARLSEEHAKAIGMANSQIQNMHSAINVHEAEKGALGQSVNELLQANIRLRAATTLLDNQGKEGFALRDTKINELVKELTEKGVLITELQNKLDVANKVIAASTNLVPPATDKELHPHKHK
jgi:predicted RNase H-like nuclease (RuvC/YqgF family)